MLALTQNSVLRVALAWLLSAAATPAWSAMDEDHKALAERYAVAWCSGEPDLVAAFLAEDGSLTINQGEPAVGREAIAAVARGFMKAFPDLVVTFDRLQEQDGRLLFHWTLTGTHTGPGGTGHTVRISGHESWRLNAEGLIAESLGHCDEAEYRRQLEQRQAPARPTPDHGTPDHKSRAH
jgi:steroid delta-isomerase-like uncharacterized protein